MAGEPIKKMVEVAARVSPNKNRPIVFRFLYAPIVAFSSKHANFF
jgi:hypothetical protein